MDKVRIAMIGLGNIGTLHLGNIEKQPKVELTAVCDIVPEKAKAAAEKYGVKAYFDTDKLLADKVCDAVIIGTPHYFHTTIGIAAMQSGHHVLVEKPISVHKADCERLIAAHEADPDWSLPPCSTSARDPTYQKMRDLVAGRRAGQAHPHQLDHHQLVPHPGLLRFRRLAGHLGRRGRRRAANQCPHNLDLLQWIVRHARAGARASATSASATTSRSRMRSPPTWTTPTAARASSSPSTGEAPGTNRLEIAGDQGKLVMEGGKITYTRNEVPATEFLQTCQASFARPPVWDVEIPVQGRGGAARRGPGELRRCDPHRQAPDRPGRGGHPFGRAGQRDALLIVAWQARRSAPGRRSL